MQFGASHQALFLNTIWPKILKIYLNPGKSVEFPIIYNNLPSYIPHKSCFFQGNSVLFDYGRLSKLDQITKLSHKFRRIGKKLEHDRKQCW